MTDDATPRESDATVPPGGDGELLSAYLAGELEGTVAEALERRLEGDPALARRLDATHRTLVGLRRLDDVEPPEGFEARLQERLAAEQTPVEQEAGRRLAATVTPLRRWMRSPAWTSAAAVLAVFALLGVGTVAVLSLGSGGADEAAGDGEAAEVQMQPFAEDDAATGAADEAPAAEQEAQEGAAEPAPREEAAGGDAAATAAQPPAVFDGSVALDSQQAVRDYFAATPEVAALLGTDAADAAAQAERYERELAALEQSVAGTPVDACLGQVTAAAGQQAVPVRVESVIFSDEVALAYAFVARGGGGNTYDTVRVHLVDPACAPVLELAFTP